MIDQAEEFVASPQFNEIKPLFADEIFKVPIGNDRDVVAATFECRANSNEGVHVPVASHGDQQNGSGDQGNISRGRG